MKVLVILIAFVATISAKSVPLVETQPNPAFGYLRKIGIPRAEEIRNGEEMHQKGETRIFGGRPAALGQFPYQVRSNRSLKYL